MAIEDENNYGLTGEQVREIVEQIKLKADGIEGSYSHVEKANQLYTATLQTQNERAFDFRTTADDLSVETGPANLLYIQGDTIEQEGVLVNTNPTAFVATGYNQYDATAGYAHVLGGNEYRIDGTYTSLGIADEPGGTTATLEVVDGKFTPENNGYVYVSGASGNILIALVWSGARDNDPYEAFSKTVITIPTIDKNSQSLPTASYGMPRIGDVADELNFADKLYIQRIGYYPYSAENLETVEAMGVEYIYDETSIFYVLETPIKYELADSVRGDYTANDYGTEEFVGATDTIYPFSWFTYGNNLVDKLRNLVDIQHIGTGLLLTGSELDIAQNVLRQTDVKNSLTESATDLPLSAKQGHVLAPQTGSGAPTAATSPYGNMVGKLYIDTTAGDAYVYVGKNGSNYIWKQISTS